MFDSAHDLLCLLRDTGGISVKAEAGEFVAVFDAQYLELDGDPPVETRTPALTARDCDLKKLGIRKGSRLTADAVEYRVRRLEPDSAGLTVVVLQL